VNSLKAKPRREGYGPAGFWHSLLDVPSHMNEGISLPSKSIAVCSIPDLWSEKRPRQQSGAKVVTCSATKLQVAENDLKQLMADVARAVEKAQEAVARITPKAAAITTETESTTSWR
jgi:hypothetical protein